MTCHEHSGRMSPVTRSLDAASAGPCTDHVCDGHADTGSGRSDRPDPGLLGILRLLSGDVRLRLLQRLAEGPCSVSELAAHLRVSIALVSHNLRRLHEVGMVRVRPKARQRVYRLDGTLARSESGRLVIGLSLASGWQARLTGPESPAHDPPVASSRASAISQFLETGPATGRGAPQRHRSGPGA